MMSVIFRPIAQNTIIRPMAQAVCLARGGEKVTYVETADKKEKTLDEEDLMGLDLKTKVGGRKIPVNANLVFFIKNTLTHLNKQYIFQIR